MIAELKRFAEENNEREIDWNDWTQYKFSIYCSYLHDDDIQYKESHAHKYGNTVYFTSEKIAKAAVKKIGEDRLKNIILKLKIKGEYKSMNKNDVFEICDVRGFG